MNPYSQYHEEFSRNGFVRIEGYLTPEEVRNLEENLKRYL